LKTEYVAWRLEVQKTNRNDFRTKLHLHRKTNRTTAFSENAKTSRTFAKIGNCYFFVLRQSSDRLPVQFSGNVTISSRPNVSTDLHQSFHARPMSSKLLYSQFSFAPDPRFRSSLVYGICMSMQADRSHPLLNRLGCSLRGIFYLFLFCFTLALVSLSTLAHFYWKQSFQGRYVTARDANQLTQARYAITLLSCMHFERKRSKHLKCLPNVSGAGNRHLIPYGSRTGSRYEWLACGTPLGSSRRLQTSGVKTVSSFKKRLVI